MIIEDRLKLALEALTAISGEPCDVSAFIANENGRVIIQRCPEQNGKEMPLTIQNFCPSCLARTALKALDV